MHPSIGVTYENPSDFLYELIDMKMSFIRLYKKIEKISVNNPIIRALKNLSVRERFLFMPNFRHGFHGGNAIFFDVEYFSSKRR